MKIANELKKYMVIVIGATILSFGLYNVHVPSGITEGGVLGAILLVNHWFGISPSIVSVVLDFTCYAIGFRFLGWAFARYSAVATITFSLTYRLFEHIGPVLPDLSGSPIIAAILGGLFVGVGVGMCVRIGGAAGGDDALAMTISKVAKIDISKAYLLTDFVVLALSLTYIPLIKIIYSLVTVTISSNVIGAIQKIGKTQPE